MNEIIHFTNNPEKPEESATVYAGVVGAETKLKAELKNAKQKDFAESIIGYLIERCRESESLAADICQDHKTWKKCYDYIMANARKKLNNISGPVRSDIVLEWAEDYYHLDDKAEEEKRAKEEEKRKKKLKDKAEKKASASAAPKAKPATEEPKRDPKSEKPKRNSRDMEGQMDMFSLLGV